MEAETVAPQNRVEAQKEAWCGKCLPAKRIVFLVGILLAISMFGIGIYGVHKCPVDDGIPFFLIVIGGIGTISKIFSLFKEIPNVSEKNFKKPESFLYLVEFIFVLFGSYWVFKEYKPDFTNPNSTKYCNKTVYMSALAYLIVQYAVIAMICSGFCCFLCCFFFVASTDAKREDAEQVEASQRVISRDID